MKNIKVIIDGHRFDSKWESQCYVRLLWQERARLITHPLLQVPFSLGVWHSLGVKKPSERFLVMDFVYVDLVTMELVVADAKGYLTPTYKAKKKAFEAIYAPLRIQELFQRR